MNKRLAIVLSVCIFVLILARPCGAALPHGTVTKVVDGDTIDVRLTNGIEERVRLIGIDTPELDGDQRDKALAAKAWVEARIKGRRVIMSTDPINAATGYRDAYKRLLVYVYENRILINTEIIRAGHSKAFLKFPFGKSERFENTWKKQTGSE